MRHTSASVLALTPLLIFPGYCFYYNITPKVIVVLFGAMIALLLLLRGSTLAQVRRLWADPVGRWFCLLAAAQVIVLLLSTLFSTSPALSWNGGNWRRLGFVSQFAVIALAFLVVLSWRAAGLRILLRASTASGTLLALYGICQYFGFDPLLSPAGYHVGEGAMTIVRPPSTLGHADYFAGYLLYIIFFGAALVAIETRLVWKALGAAGVTAGSIAIVFSGTRGALLGLVAGGLLIWIANSLKFTRRRALVAAGWCGMGIAFYVSPGGLKLRARSLWALEDTRGGARLWLWRDSIRMVRHRLLLGFGPETFGLEFPRYQSLELSRAYPDFYHESPHNIFLDALVSEGIPGAGVLAGFGVLAWFAARRGIQLRQPAAPFLAAALVAGLTGGLFVCFTLSGYLYFYSTVAMLAGLAVPSGVGLSAPQAPRLLRVAALALSVTAATLFLHFSLRLMSSDMALEQANRDLAAGRIDASVAAYARSQQWHPAGSSDDLYFSRALVARSGTISREAFLVAKRATATSEERQNAWYNLAQFFSTQNDAAEMEACLRRSIGASPNWFKPHWALAQLLLLSGRQREAVAEAVRATDLNGGKNAEIAKFLQAVHHHPPSSSAE